MATPSILEPVQETRRPRRILLRILLVLILIILMTALVSGYWLYHITRAALPTLDGVAFIDPVRRFTQ